MWLLGRAQRHGSRHEVQSAEMRRQPEITGRLEFRHHWLQTGNNGIQSFVVCSEFKGLLYVVCALDT